MKNKIILIICLCLFISCDDDFKNEVNNEKFSYIAPEVISISPAHGETGVLTDSPITVKFNVPVKPSSINPSSFVVKDSKNQVVDGYINVDGDTVVFTHNNPFRVLRDYTLTVTTSVSNMNSIAMKENITATFTVGHKFDEALELYLPFNGNSLDESGNEYDGIQYGNPALAEDRFGNQNKAYYFDGVDDYIQLLESNNLRPDPITIVLWIKAEETWLEQYLIQKSFNYWLSAVNCYLHQNILNIQVRTDVDGAGTFNILSINFTDKNLWHFIVITYGNGIIRFYLDYNTRRSVTAPSMIGYVNNTYDWIIGREGRLFKGRIDDIRIYSRVLSEDEVEVLYHEGGYGY